ncbi:MAG: histidine kinase [Candidatus Sumerlaeota bacterium]
MNIAERRTFFWFSGNRGQFPLGQALSLSLGRALRSKGAAINTALWGLGTGVLYFLVSPPEYRLFNFVACFLIAFVIGYFARVPWRWKVVRGSDFQILAANSVVALVCGYAMVYTAFVIAMLLTNGQVGFTKEFFRIIRLISTCSFVFPIVGYYMVVGDEHERRTRRLLRAKAYQEKLAEEARIVALRSQINPHFFFNALNTVAALIPTRPADAERAVELLATALRPVLTRDQPMIATVESELRVARAYVEIEKLRLTDRVEFTFAVEDATLLLELPSLVLQPLIENAVRHGAMMTTAPYRIETKVFIKDAILIIEIRNAAAENFEQNFAKGIGTPPFPRGHALHNIWSRVRALFGTASSLSVWLFEPSPAGITVLTINPREVKQ